VDRGRAEVGLVDVVLLWYVVPTNPQAVGRPDTNRRPTRDEVGSSSRFLARVARGRRIVSVGRLAHAVTGAPYVRHPAHGGAADFRAGVCRLLM
jgi:hypothetical protein